MERLSSFNKIDGNVGNLLEKSKSVEQI